MKRKLWAMVAACGLAMVGAVAGGKNVAAARIVAGPGGPGTVTLPYTVADNMGNQWRVYQYGQLQQSGNMPLYSQGAMLHVNGAQPMLQGRARMDDKTGELVLENMNANGMSVTRRILFQKEGNVVRYIDIVKNTTGQDQNAALMIQTSLNYGVNTSAMVADPKKKDQNFAWVAQTSGNGAVLEMFSGKNTKTPMVINYQPGNSVVQATMQVTIKPNQEVALMHLHGVMPTQDACSQYVTKLKESDLFKNIPTNIRKLIVNFAGGTNFVGEIEVLRGDLLDVVELKGGDQLKGTLKEDKFELTTFYGPVTLPVEKVIAVLNVGAFRPRQLVVTTDGQIFGGTMKQETLSLQLSSGQLTKIPLSQVNRVGYRKRPGEPEEWTFDKPMVLMRSGERVAVQMPANAFEVATRYGKVSLKPEQLAAALLQSEEAGLHQFILADGGKFSGLLAADALEMKLETGGGPEQIVKFPVSAVSRFQLTPKVAEPDDTNATIKLANDDQLVGTIGGQLKIDTSFDTLSVNAAEIRELKHAAGGGVDVQVVLFDGSSVSGQLQQMELSVQTAGGLSLKVPLALLEEYIQPQPTPSKEMEEKIVALIKELSAEDWKVRDRAQQSLMTIGPASIGALKRLRDGQPAEAQQRIDTILKELDKAKDKPGPTKTTTGPQPPAVPMLIRD
jgi:hypothetical protein